MHKCVRLIWSIDGDGTAERTAVNLVASNDLMEYRAMCHCFFLCGKSPPLESGGVAPTYSFSIQSRLLGFCIVVISITTGGATMIVLHWPKFSCFLGLCSLFTIFPLISRNNPEVTKSRWITSFKNSWSECCCCLCRWIGCKRIFHW